MRKLNLKKLAFLLMAPFFTACTNDDAPTPASDKDKKANYALVSIVDSGGAKSFSYYLQTSTDLNTKNKYYNSDAIELFSNGYSAINSFNNNIFLNTYVPDQKVTKWEIDQNGNYSMAGEISVPELAFQGNMCFKNENTAFVGGVGTKIIIFNPTTMKKTGTIDLSDISRVGEATNYPNLGDKINTEVITEIIIRGNHLFAAVYYINNFESFTPASATADLIVIDLTKVNTNATNTANVVLNTTSSDKGAIIGGWNYGWGVPFMGVDEKGDLYVMCHNLWGLSQTGKKTCLLRVRKGETTFDDSYYFDLEAASKGTGNPVLNFNYYKDGVFFGIATDLSKVDPSDPWSFIVDEIAQWYKFDIYNKTATLVDPTYTKGNNAAKVHFEKGNAYIPYDTKEKSFIKEVNISSLETETIFETEGPAEIIKIKK